ncbi:MAG: 50S ribosomal protein L17 [Calditrichaeota bacterium]|nr:50S ribosomal protein L17 [Calditrichota bacterium]
MRHRNKIRKLGRTKAHRKATLKNLAGALIEHQQIKTTLVKAKAAQSTIEKLITHGKKDTVAARRQAFKLLQNHHLVQKLFNEIAPTFKERSGGYSRIVKLGRREGDGAELAILQLVGFESLIVEEKKTSEKKKKATPAKKEGKKAAEKKPKETKEAGEEAPVEAKAEDKEEKKAEEKPEKKTEKKEKKKSTKKSSAKKETKADTSKKETNKKSEKSKSESDKKEEKS